MKKFIAGLVVGLIVMVPISAGAWSKKQMAQPIYGVDCGSTDYVIDRTEGQQGTGYGCSAAIHVFDDSGNKCYVVKGANASGISCIKTNTP